VWSVESKLVFTQGRCWISVVGERGAGDRQHPIHLLLLAIKQRDSSCSTQSSRYKRSLDFDDAISLNIVSFRWVMELLRGERVTQLQASAAKRMCGVVYGWYWVSEAWLAESPAPVSPARVKQARLMCHRSE